MTANFRICFITLFLCAYLSRHHGAVALSSVASMSPAVISPISRHAMASCSHLTLGSRRHNGHRRSCFVLHATLNDDKTAAKKPPSARDQGIYARPSAAIERGSGFFIPGLEGSRIRFLFGITVLIADAANHFLVGGRPGDWGQTTAEVVSAFYGALLLLQGSIESAVEKGYAGGSDGGVIGMESEDGAIATKEAGSSGRFSDATQGADDVDMEMRRIAKTIITFTPATYFRLVDEGQGVLYSVGVGNDESEATDANEQKRLAKISLDALSESRGGRVALPSEHPASKLLPEAATRCILVQKVNEYEGSRRCMLIGSDKLLPSFTKNDLRWIGQLADYNNLLVSSK